MCLFFLPPTGRTDAMTAEGGIIGLTGVENDPISATM